MIAVYEKPNMVLTGLVADPFEEWQRMLRFANLSSEARSAMYQTVEAISRHSTEIVVQTYEYLRSVPETAAILGWETGIEEAHLEERRRFFTIWLSRTLGLDTSEEFAHYLFRAGQYHAGHGPRKIHTPPAYVTVSKGLILDAFSRIIADAGLPGEVIAKAMGGWAKYLMVQLNQMDLGYQVALEFSHGEMPVRVKVFGRLRSIIGENEFTVHVKPNSQVADLLKKVFNYYPQARRESMERAWDSEEKLDSQWVEVHPVYIPRMGWRFLLNGRDVQFEDGFETQIEKEDVISIFPPGR
jgi:molybdopterin converting factor small subunit